MGNIPPVTKNLLIINVLCFVGMFVARRYGIDINDLAGLHFFLASDFNVAQLISYMGAGLIQEVVQYIEYATVLSNYDSVQTPFGIIPMSEYLNQMTTVGASGAVYGILLAFGMLFPNSEMFVFPLPVPIKAKYFVLGYAALELVLGITGGDGIAHFAHLGGMLFGLILILYWKKKNGGGRIYY